MNDVACEFAYMYAVKISPDVLTGESPRNGSVGEREAFTRE